MRWSENETCKFVKLYLSYEYLWNSSHPAYKVKQMRLQAYRNLIRDLRSSTGILLNEDEVKVKIKNLRSTYTQELTKIIQRSGPDCTYKPTIKWFNDWHKCFKTSTKKQLEDSNCDEEDNEDPSEKVWVPEEEGALNDAEATDADPFVAQDDSYVYILKSEPNETILNIPETTQKIKQKKMKRRSPSTDQSYKTFRGSMDSNLESRETKEDEFDIYGKYIASQLRQMDLQKALRLQLEIQSLVSEARITELSKN